MAFVGRVLICVLCVLVDSMQGTIYSCSKSEMKCTSVPEKRACHCDAFCAIMQDCCSDYTSSISIPTSEAMKYRKHLTCHQKLPRDHHYHMKTYISKEEFVYIRTCPKDYQLHDIKMLCEKDDLDDLFLNWPVSSKETRVTYKNIYCSRCWDDNDVYMWKVEYHCANESAEVNPGISKGSSVFRGKTVAGFQCGPPVPERPVIEPPGFESPGYPPGVTKPNGLPHGNTPWDPRMPHPPGDLGGPPGNGGKPPQIPDRSKLYRRQKRRSKYFARIKKISYRSVVGLWLQPPIKPIGKSGKDLIAEALERRGSPPSRRKRDTFTTLYDCKPKFIYPFCDNLRSCEELDIIHECPAGWTNKIIDKLCAGEVFGRMRLNYNGSMYKNEACVVCNGLDPELTHCRFNSPALPAPSYGGAEYQVFSPPLSLIFDLDAGAGMKEVSGRKESILLPECNSSQVIDVFTYECRNLFCFGNNELVDGKCAPRNNSGGRDYDMDDESKECAWVLLEPDEFVVLPNSTILVHSSGSIVALNETRDLSNSSVYVCEDILGWKGNHSKLSMTFREGTAIASALCLVLSLLCLVALLVVYSLVPELRNTPGLGIMCLAIALLLAQFMFLVSGRALGSPRGCEFVAMAIHFFFLAAFCWMCALAVDLTLTFSSATATHGDRRVRLLRFIKFSIVAWVTPLVVVILARITDETESGVYPFNPGYGDGYCWITNKEGLIIWFIVPVAAILTVNMTMYGITVYKICKATRAARMVRREDKCNVLLYIKLSVIMGATWIFAFIWMATKDTALEYLFIIFNGLQGVFIFIAFVCRRKIHRLLQRRLSGKKILSKRLTLTTRLTSSTSGKTVGRWAVNNSR